jgi:hypothetical protein
MPTDSAAAPESKTDALYLPAVERELQPGIYKGLIESALRKPASISPAMRELIGASTSFLNKCRFSTKAHAAAAAELFGSEELAWNALENLDSSSEEKDNPLLRFTAKVMTNVPAVGKRDVEVVRTAGWGDEAIYFAITTAGSTPPGVPEMLEEAHRPLAEHDYVREEGK